METNKQKLRDLIARLKEKGLVSPTFTDTWAPVNTARMQAKIKDLVEKIKADKYE